MLWTCYFCHYYEARTTRDGECQIEDVADRNAHARDPICPLFVNRLNLPKTTTPPGQSRHELSQPTPTNTPTPRPIP